MKDAQARAQLELFLGIEVLRRQRGKHPEYVFIYQGRRIRWANTRGWRRALKRAGIDNFRWHDLRHTWASWLVQHGIELYQIQEMGGWKSAEMVRRHQQKGATEHRNPLIVHYKCW